MKMKIPLQKVTSLEVVFVFEHAGYILTSSSCLTLETNTTRLTTKRSKFPLWTVVGFQHCAHFHEQGQTVNGP